MANLPLRDRGLAIGLATPRAAAAYLTGWERAAAGWAATEAVAGPLSIFLLQCHGAKDSYEAAVADLTALSPKLRGSPLLDVDVPPKQGHQRAIMSHVHEHIKHQLLADMSLADRALFRSNGRTGAGAFTLAPLESETFMLGAGRLAVRHRLLLPLDQVVAPATPATHCQHRSEDRVCGEALAAATARSHATGCKLGGWVGGGGHNAVRDVLWRWVQQHIDPAALVEQRLDSLRPADAPRPPGTDGDVLDVVWHDASGRLMAVDVAIVHAESRDTARQRACAGRDGCAAEREERSKATRYAGLPVSPFVLEVGDRPGPLAAGVVRTLAAASGPELRSQAAALLWQRVSVAMQTGLACQVATAALPREAVAAALAR